MSIQNFPSVLMEGLADRQDDLVVMVQELVSAPSPSPPGNTTLVAEKAYDPFQKIDGATVTKYEPVPGIVNLVARICSGRPGKRLVLNGHLDTYPICEHLDWTVPPLGGIIKDGKIYGRGVSDMKGGIAASILAATVLAEQKQHWSGEIVITLAGDEETMGKWGSKWLLENVEVAKGDAMICGDAGSPTVVRFGEKGLYWLELSAKGSPAHGAHVHKGINAINRLRKALDIVERLEDLTVNTPPSITEAIAHASDVSERLSGKGESETLQRVTVNIGMINGGTLMDLVPSEAKASIDIRLPVGISCMDITNYLKSNLDSEEGLSWQVLQSYDLTYTRVAHPIVQSALSASAQVMQTAPVVNMRVGASDTRLYRAAGVPSIVVGPTPYNMGDADEHVVVTELLKAAKIHALILYDMLSSSNS